MTHNNPNGVIVSFNDHWRFHLGFPEGGDSTRHFYKANCTLGPGARVYNDSAWREVRLPHDWGTELELDFTVDPMHGAAPIGEGVHPSPIAFYRKTWFVPEEWNDYSVSLHFDGVFRDCEILVNGQYVMRNLSGYTGFSVSLDDLLFCGEENCISIRVDATQSEGWFYEGAGIYRNVWLRLLPRIHLDVDSAFVHLNNDVDTVVAEFDAVNDTASDAVVPCSFSLAEMTAEAQIAIPAYSAEKVVLEIPFSDYHPWSIDDPYLYSAVLRVDSHSHEIRTGLRRFRFDANEGFFLNGKPVKLLGSCTHQDLAIVGVALNDDEQEYKVSILKKNGFNSLRTSHNPPAPALLDACDKLGLVVMAESRLFGSTPEGFHQMKQLVLAGRNHPSVILWSIGNEEMIQNTEVSRRQAERVCRMVHQMDPTRPTTYGACNGETLTGINSAVDVRGVNYINITQDLSMVDRYHAARPEQPIVGSEESSAIASRSVWHSDLRRGLTENFDNCGPFYMLGAEALWKAYMSRPFLSGAFIWTGFDYRGEASKQGYITNYGVIDLCGFPKSTAHYYRAEGKKDPYIFMYPDWNRKQADGTPVKPGTDVEVIVYTNAASLELLVNGVSVGKQTRSEHSSLSFTVPYHPGTVTAIGYQADGCEVLRKEMHTYGVPVRITAEVCRIGNTSFICPVVVDENGIICEDAGNRLSFRTDTARLVGAGNGDPSDPDGELPVLNVPALPLKGVRVYESFGDYQYTDQLLEDIVGQNDPQRPFMHATKFAPESDAKFAAHDGRRRKLPEPDSDTDRFIELYCTFWLDSSDVKLYQYLHLGYAAGFPEIELNGTQLKLSSKERIISVASEADSASVLSNFDGNADEVKLFVGSVLTPGENVLRIVVRPNEHGVYAAGRKLWLTGEPTCTLKKRLWNGHALCIAEGTGTVSITSDGLESLTVRL